MTTPHELKERLLIALEKQKLSQNDLAKSLHVTRSTISFWLKNDSIPTRHLVSISQLLGVSLDWLLHGTGPVSLLECSARTPLTNCRQREFIEALRRCGDHMGDVAVELFTHYFKPHYGDNANVVLELANFSRRAKTALIDTQGRLLEMNIHFRQFLEIDLHENIHGTSALTWLHEQDLVDLLKHYNQWQCTKAPQQYGVASCRLKKKSGTLTDYVTIHYSLVSSPSGESLLQCIAL